MTRVHRNSGKIEHYDSDKVKSGVIESCRAVFTPLGAAERFAEEVESKVQESVKEKAAVTSRDLKRLAKDFLGSYSPDAAEVYAMEEDF